MFDDHGLNEEFEGLSSPSSPVSTLMKRAMSRKCIRGSILAS